MKYHAAIHVIFGPKSNIIIQYNNIHIMSSNISIQTSNYTHHYIPKIIYIIPQSNISVINFNQYIHHTSQQIFTAHNKYLRQVFQKYHYKLQKNTHLILESYIQQCADPSLSQHMLLCYIILPLFVHLEWKPLTKKCVI